MRRNQLGVSTGIWAVLTVIMLGIMCSWFIIHMSFTYYYKEKFDRAAAVGARFAAANRPNAAMAVKDALRLMGMPYQGVDNSVRVIRSNQSVKAIEMTGQFPMLGDGSVLPANVSMKVVSNPPPLTPISYLVIAVTRDPNPAHPASLNLQEALCVPVVLPPVRPGGGPPDYSWAMVAFRGGGAFEWVDTNGTGGYGGCSYPITEYAFSGLAAPANQPSDVFSF